MTKVTRRELIKYTGLGAASGLFGAVDHKLSSQYVEGSINKKILELGAFAGAAGFILANTETLYSLFQDGDDDPPASGSSNSPTHKTHDDDWTDGTPPSSWLFQNENNGY